MQLIKDGKRWVAKTKFEDRHIPKGAGFRWDPAKRQWWTDKMDRAAKLIEYATPEVKAELEATAKRRQEALELSRAADADVNIPAPDGLHYLPYQKAGIAYGLNTPNVLIADEMGLGKTIQALGIINADPSIKSVLIIVPASLRINWYREARKWLVRDYTVEIADGDDFPGADIVIVNYERLGKHRNAIRARQWDLLVCDEAHYIKNPKAQRTKEIMGSWDKKKQAWGITPIEARRKVMLTGTPILNRPVELWNILRLLDKDRWTNFMYFGKRYCNAHHNGWGWDFTGANEETLPELQRILRETIMVRRLKKDVLTELPPKRRQIIEIPANGMKRVVNKQAKAWAPYEEQFNRLQAKADSAKAAGDEKAYRQAVEELTTAMEVAFDELSALRHEMGVAKVPAVIEHIKETLENTDKLVVFAHHHDVVNAIAEAFSDIAVKLTGVENSEERQAAVDRFQNDPSCRLFIGTIGAAGVGLTLTAASMMIFAELDWVPGRVTQAEDRIHRIGQLNSVLIQHLVVDGSLDAKMAWVLVQKQEIIDKALDDPIAATASETRTSAPSPIRRPSKYDEEAAQMTPEQLQAVHEGLRILAGWDEDRATEKNDIGFNAFDGDLGHDLAMQDSLTPRQAALGRKMLRKYHRQLGWDLLEATGLVRK
jgi:SWI/SNF-related matrix-associated actin-dependent regulator 1 of chromatin subfamily A